MHLCKDHLTDRAADATLRLEIYFIQSRSGGNQAGGPARKRESSVVVSRYFSSRARRFFLPHKELFSYCAERRVLFSFFMAHQTRQLRAFEIKSNSVYLMRYSRFSLCQMHYYCCQGKGPTGIVSLLILVSLITAPT